MGHDGRRGPVRVRVPLKVLHKSASYFLLGPALGRVGDALSEAHRLGLGLKGRHRLQFRASGGGRAAVVVLMAPRLASARRIPLVSPQSPASCLRLRLALASGM